MSPDDVAGIALSPYSGGRVDAPIVRTPMPVVKTDAVSMYSTISCLEDLWRFYIAERTVVVDATEDARALLAALTYEQLLDRRTWLELNVIVEVEPNGERLPARAHYLDSAPENIALVDLTIPPEVHGGRVWYALADCVAAKLLGVRSPRIVGALRFDAVGIRAGLKSTSLRGLIPIDPMKQDFIKIVVEHRKTVETRTELSPTERKRTSNFLKTVASISSYGALAQVTRDERNAYDASFHEERKKWHAAVDERVQLLLRTAREATGAWWDAFDELGAIVPDIEYLPGRGWRATEEFQIVPHELRTRNVVPRGERFRWPYDEVFLPRSIRPDWVWRRGRWHMAGEFDDVPVRLIDRSNKPTAPPAAQEGLVARVHGNLDVLCQRIRTASGDPEISDSEILDALRTPQRPKGRSIIRGNVERLRRLIRERTGEDVERTDVLGFFSSERRPSEAAARIGAEAALADVRPDRPKTTVRVIGCDCCEAEVTYPEVPAQYFTPHLATLVTAGARLVLALVQHAVERLGGNVAYMDTDSAFIVSTREGGLVPCNHGKHVTPDGQPAVLALTYDQVDEIRAQLRALIPYDPDAVKEFLKLEDDNIALLLDDSGQPVRHRDGDLKGKFVLDRPRREQLYLYSLSEKRYCVYNILPDGQTLIRSASEHGLGHLLDPIGDKNDPNRWTREVWRYLVDIARGLNPEEPPFFARRAYTQFAFTSPYLLLPFDGAPFGERLQPFRFMLACIADDWYGERHSTARFVSPYERDPARWDSLELIDLYSGERHRADGGRYEPRTIGTYVKSIWSQRHVFKARLPSGEIPTVEDSGLLSPTQLIATEVLLTGRETLFSTSTEDDELVEEQIMGADGRLQVFGPKRLDGLRARVRACGVREVVRESGVARRAVQEFLNRGAVPHRTTLPKLRRAVRIIEERNGGVAL